MMIISFSIFGVRFREIALSTLKELESQERLTVSAHSLTPARTNEDKPQPSGPHQGPSLIGRAAEPSVEWLESHLYVASEASQSIMLLWMMCLMSLDAKGQTDHQQDAGGGSTRGDQVAS